MGSLFSLSLIILSLASFKAAADGTKFSARFLDLIIRNYSFQSYGEKSTTGKFHPVHLPANFSGIEVDTGKFRCGSLRRYGAQIKEFQLGNGVIIQPCVERVVLVRQNLGSNWSSIYYSNYNLSGYELVSPILGLLAYNAGSDVNFSDPFEVGIHGEKPITVDFRNVTKHRGRAILCAKFERSGKVTVEKMVSPFACLTKRQGHFAAVVKAAPPPAGPEGRKKEGRLSGWKVAVGSTVGAALGAFLLGLLLVAMLVKVKKKTMMEEMERRAYEEEALQVSMAGHVRAPVLANGNRY